MSAPCIHGYMPGDCLICRTLGSGAPQTSAGQATLAQSTLAQPTLAQPTLAEPTPAPAYRTEHHKAPLPESAEHSRGRGGSLLLALAALVAIAAAVWIVAGIVLSALHVLELIAVCAGAGWVGYRIGHYRGSRSHRGEP